MIVTCGPSDNEMQVHLEIPRGKKLALMLSSGADSAILLYMLCVELTAEGRSVQDELKKIFTIPKVDGAEEHAEKITNWISQKLGIALPAPTVDAPPNLAELPHSDIIKKSLIYFGQKYDVNYGYLADQRPVPIKVAGEYPHRTPTEKNPLPEYLGLPFNHLDKSHTIDLHYRFNTLPLLELSHSCTQCRAGRCGNCYHCNERKWAFDRLGKTDPGVN
jgi:hypothetical protein